ncbi:MAG: NOB1 family endonuclease [Candidatus Aenigmarchaeota archaeon]|nr:NOB1 family endonuclease [Candidatus Aenigmarchaeota archaeon]
MDDNTIYVLDSTAFLENYSDAFVDKACATVYNVAEEIKSPYARIQFDMLQKAGLSILAPDDASLKAVTETVKKTGDKLSSTDISVIALALEFKGKGKKAVIVTDDYGIQNVAKSLGVKFMPVSQKGISRSLEWKRKCTACGKDTGEEICPVCGSETKFVSKAKKS